MTTNQQAEPFSVAISVRLKLSDRHRPKFSRNEPDPKLTVVVLACGADLPQDLLRMLAGRRKPRVRMVEKAAKRRSAPSRDTNLAVR
jgi:hypothetical protein